MHILALEPYYGGSHKAFLSGWEAHSRHTWSILGLPAYKWKWRMRHAAVAFAAQVKTRAASGESWDAVFCSDMLDLGAFLGLAPPAMRQRPIVVYFHENQLTYPVQAEDERDYTYGFTNMTTALAASRVWFNSAYHRASFLEALEGILKRMPDHQPLEAIQQIGETSDVWPQGIHPFPARTDRAPGPLRILWAARWEFDKNPEAFFQSLDILQSRGTDFRLSVIGEQFRDAPAVFKEAEERFRSRIDRWGYQEDRQAYKEALAEADVVVSTARHEFFGVSIVEAVAAGAYPLLPKRLSYPELFGMEDHPDFFYDGEAAGLADRLSEAAAKIDAGDLWQGDPERGVRQVSRFLWPNLAPHLDTVFEEVGND